MSNITCPTCGVTSYDCGKAGFKTKQEIELEKKLKIAIEALEFARNTYPMCELKIIEKALMEINK